MLYADFETTSGDKSKTSVNPYHNCDVLGIAITVDDNPKAYYIPVGHIHGGNLDRGSVVLWWQQTLKTCDVWVNHNVKYDAHVSRNCLGITPGCEFYDTMNIAKVVDSDRGLTGGYGITALSSEWLHDDISNLESAFKPYLFRNKDYGIIPSDLMGEYACQDVLTCRRIHKYIEACLPDQCRGVADTENQLTRVLFAAEVEGMCVDPKQLKIKEFTLLRRLLAIDEELTEIVGRSFRPHVSDDCFDVLCNQYGLPIMGWTDAGLDDDGNAVQGNPSFDKAALVRYAAHPLAPVDVVELIREYRGLNTLNNLFVKKYQEIEVEGKLHPSYNQTVRTGRMSCRRPNAQQLSKAAKTLIIPPAGYSFISIDYSQIEFRLIIHYIDDHYAIEAYKNDPYTDFHDWMADLCQIDRQSAKTMNFLMGYGGGKKLATETLSMNMGLVGKIKAEIALAVDNGELSEDDALAEFKRKAEARAADVYDRYHQTLPNLKRTARRCTSACKMKGYVHNLYGRWRKLPQDKSHHAFNTVCQASAADLMKERTVACYRAIQDTSIKIVASVHDETLFIAPHHIANDPRTLRDLAAILEHPNVELKVPIKCAAGVSAINWKEAAACADKVEYDLADAQGLSWAKNI